jgi:hypothetical protein
MSTLLKVTLINLLHVEIQKRGRYFNSSDFSIELIYSYLDMSENTVYIFYSLIPIYGIILPISRFLILVNGFT